MTLFTSCLSPTFYFVCLWPFHVLFFAYSLFCVYGPFDVLFIAYSILCVFFTCYFPLHFPLCVSGPFHVLFIAYSFLCVFMAIFTSCLSPTVSFVCLLPFSRFFLCSFFIAYSLDPLCVYKPFHVLFPLQFPLCVYGPVHVLFSAYSVLSRRKMKGPARTLHRPALARGPREVADSVIVDNAACCSSVHTGLQGLQIILEAFRSEIRLGG